MSGSYPWLLVLQFRGQEVAMLNGMLVCQPVPRNVPDECRHAWISIHEKFEVTRIEQRLVGLAATTVAERRVRRRAAISPKK